MISYRVSQNLTDCYRIYPMVASLDNYYPDFSHWYWNTLVPSTVTADSFVILAEDHGNLVGVALAKQGSEPKLRCVRVLPELKGRGIALHLIDRALQQLNHSHPAVTVAEEMIHDYSRILVNRFDFLLSQVDKGLYRRGKLEYVFNGKFNQRVKSPL